MLTLEDSIEIKTTPSKLLAWFMDLDRHFTEWHPNHTKFEKVTGGMEVGDIIRFEERIKGKWFKFNFTITEKNITDRGWTIETRAPYSKIIFIAEQKDDLTIFTHREQFGLFTSDNALIRKLLAPIFRFLTNPKFRYDLIENDIREDNVNLKQIMERQ